MLTLVADPSARPEPYSSVLLRFVNGYSCEPRMIPGSSIRIPGGRFPPYMQLAAMLECGAVTWHDPSTLSLLVHVALAQSDVDESSVLASLSFPEVCIRLLVQGKSQLSDQYAEYLVKEILDCMRLVNE